MDRRVELRIAVLIVLAGIVWLWGALQIHATVRSDLIGETGFPIAIGLAFVVIGSILALRSYRSMRADPPPAGPVVDKGDEKGHPSSSIRPLLIVLVCFGWMELLHEAGFMIVSALAIAAVLWLMEFRRPIPLLAVAVLSSVGMFLIFDVLLQVNLPGGPLAPITDSWRL